MREDSEIKNFIKYDPTSGELHWKEDRGNQFAKKGSRAGYKHARGYIYIEFNGNAHAAHRLAWFLHYGEWPKQQLDHINGDRADNRIENLRDVTARNNSSNTRKHRAGKKLGSCLDKESGKFLSSISFKRNIYLGRFKTEEEASEMYNIALLFDYLACDKTNEEFRDIVKEEYKKRHE
jgi:hypothetical protein